MKANKTNVLALAEKLGVSKYFNPPKTKHPSWRKHPLAAFWLHELGHLVMGHLDDFYWGCLTAKSLGDEYDKQCARLTEAEKRLVAITLMEIPPITDEWSVQQWTRCVSEYFNWSNTTGNQWGTDSPYWKSRNNFFEIFDPVGLERVGVDFSKGLFIPEYTHLRVSKGKIYLHNNSTVLDSGDVAKLSSNIKVVELFNEFDNFMVYYKPKPCS